MTAQISRTARRFSTVIAPQLTKLDPVPCLQSYTKLLISIVDITKLHNALENYILHNATVFEPIDFEVTYQSNSTPGIVLRAQIYVDEVVLFENQKRLVSVTLADPDSGLDGPTVAKIRHPISGIKMFEIVDFAHSGNLQIMSSTDDTSRCQIDTTTNPIRKLLAFCGMTFVPEWWLVRQEGTELGKIMPKSSFFKENAVEVSWGETTDNELRLLMLCFGLVQIVREGFPQLLHLIRDYRQRRGNA
uniref:Pkinase_fungal domain-containing protein n=1 Tax=Panagrellus redivivus TaxID=6233 RepID=A0A7E4VXR4_PANRE